MTTEYQLSRSVILTPGTFCRLKFCQGIFRFKYATVSSAGAVSLTFIGGRSGHHQFKSVRPDRVKVVCRSKK